jgi:hypothetical protein
MECCEIPHLPFVPLLGCIPNKKTRVISQIEIHVFFLSSQGACYYKCKSSELLMWELLTRLHGMWCWAYDDFCLWRRQHKISCSQKRFKYRTLFRDEYGFFLNCKAFNGRLVCEWLLSKLVEIKAALPAGVILDDRFDLCETALTLIDNYTIFCHHPRKTLLFFCLYMVSFPEK